LLPSGRMTETSVFHGVCGIFLISYLPSQLRRGLSSWNQESCVVCIIDSGEVYQERGLAQWHTAIAISVDSKSEFTLWSAERILLLMVIWVQFLAPDLTSFPNLDRYVRWRLGERRIGMSDGLKIQIRPIRPIRIREQALVRPRGLTRACKSSMRHGFCWLKVASGRISRAQS
jgi:hypothetical protein